MIGATSPLMMVSSLWDRQERTRQLYESSRAGSGMSILQYTVWRGADVGVRLTPHRNRKGVYTASKRKAGPHFHVTKEEDLIPYLRQGYMIRMANREAHHPPSLICADAVEGWRPR